MQPETFEETKAKMTLFATDMIAAAIIAEKSFPQKAILPRFIPLPFNNLGHFYLFDNTRFLHILYQTVMELKEQEKKSNNGSVGWAILAFTVVVFPMTFSSFDLFLPSLIPGFIAFLIVYAVLQSIRLKKFNKKLAEHKAGVIERLLKGEWSKTDLISVPNRLNEVFRKCGDGAIAKKDSPVLIMFSDEQPFPGFGSLQLDNKFICRPKELAQAIEKNERDLFENISRKIKDSLAASGIPHVGFGKVIVLNFDSINTDSPWLDEHKIPILYKEIAEEQDLNKLDEFASVRVYFVVEVLFPKYDSAACFFIRPFKAGNSAGCHVAITTIGPPDKRESYIRSRLIKYKFQDELTEAKKTSKVPPAPKNITEDELARIRDKYNETFHELLTFSALESIDPLEDKDYDELQLETRIQEIIKFDPSWPGKYYYIKYNIREQKSLTMGGDFFGYPELKGSISTIYDQLSRTILEAIEQLGFDISNYKDKDGKFSINAENIDKLIVGEVITMKSSDEDNKKEKVVVKKSESVSAGNNA